MPLFNSAKHLFYNAKLLKEAGFDHPPATLDEFVAQAQGTTKQGQWGSLWSWKQSEALLCDWLSLMFTQPGAQFLDSHGKAVFNTMGGTEALQGWWTCSTNTKWQTRPRWSPQKMTCARCCKQAPTP